MTDATRSQPPQPFPRGFQPNGALYGELPLAVPRKAHDSCFIVVLSRDEGVTKYKIRRNMDSEDAFVEGLFDTRNEWIFLAGMLLHWHPDKKKFRVKIGDIPISRIVAGDPPADDPTRTIVDHANGEILDNQFDVFTTFAV